MPSRNPANATNGSPTARTAGVSPSSGTGASRRGGVASAGVSSSASPADVTIVSPDSSLGIAVLRRARSASRMLVPFSVRPYVAAMRSHSPKKHRSLAITAVILLAAAACEKSKPAQKPADAIVPDGVPALNLAAKPTVLFQLFGDPESPHMIPIAAVMNGVIKPIGLTAGG